MPIIRPISILRNITELEEVCEKEKEPVFLTKNGYGDLVIMKIEVYDELLRKNKTDKTE